MQTLLYLLAQTFQTKPFRPINEALRRALVRTAPGFIRLVLGGQWVLRNSLTEPWNFSPLFSDIDLALIVEEANQNNLYVEEKLTRHAKLKKWFKILGEVEVYSPEEWQIKTQLLMHHGDLIAYSRSLRKINWMKGDFRNRKGPYHRAKALRAIAKCRRIFRSKKILFLNLKHEAFPLGFPMESSGRMDFYETDFHSASDADPELIFQLITAVNFYPYLLSRSIWEKYRFPILAMENLEFRAYRRFAEKRWVIQSDWLVSLRGELARPRFQELSSRTQTQPISPSIAP
jgi:hypothetical protein